MPMGVNKRVSIVTCMDSRLMMNEILGLKIGDAEILRNAGACVVVTRLVLAAVRCWLCSEAACPTQLSPKICHHVTNQSSGGRVTPDVVRSLFVAQEVPELATSEVLIIHHTDCGAQVCQGGRAGRRGGTFEALQAAAVAAEQQIDIEQRSACRSRSLTAITNPAGRGAPLGRAAGAHEAAAGKLLLGDRRPGGAGGGASGSDRWSSSRSRPSFCCCH
jgi:hypothetical protein